MKDRWIKDIHDRMARFETDGPDGLWDEIEKEIDRQRPTVFHVRHVAGIAAMIAVALCLWFAVDTKPDLKMPATASIEETTEVRKSEIAYASDSDLPIDSTPVTAVSAKEISDNLATEPVVENTGVTSDEQSLATDTVSPNGDDVSDKPAITLQTEIKPVEAVQNITKTTDSRRQLSVSLFTSGALNSNNRSVSSAMAVSGTMGSNGVQWHDSPLLGIMLVNRGLPITSETRHHLPVRTGIKIGMSLTDRLSVESGLTYTMLTTDIREGSDNHYMSGRRRLHYVGIPLSVKYRVFSFRRFDFYLSSGVLAEKSVSGKTVKDYIIDNRQVNSETENVNVKPLQWSVNASAGLQFNLARSASVFAEPGISYYFDNNSAVETIYSDKPLNFNLNVGLRFTFGSK